MNSKEIEANSWTFCEECQGRGKKSRKLRKKARLQYQRELEEYESRNREGLAPTRPKRHLEPCSNCSGSGLTPCTHPPTADKLNYPHIAIVGGGIGGTALAVACLHRGIPFSLFERDSGFDIRSQGYGLTLQQASKAMEGFGLVSLKDAVVSTRHLVHTTEGKVIGEWGMRKWMQSDSKTAPRKTNLHIARQSLRLALLEQLGNYSTVQWGHQLINIKETENKDIDLTFLVNGELKKVNADLIVGADGIRSSVRKLLIGEENYPLRYLGCIVILGICSLEALQEIDSPLLDSATVFQTANGNERIYMMPYSSDSIMWQLSFPMSESEAKALSNQGRKALKEEACRRTKWHTPIPQILEATLETQISGYPVYDRDMLQSEDLKKANKMTLIGDAAHPMSPFKGQGANQALLDALSLARSIFKECGPYSQWKTIGVRDCVLTKFETEMLERSALKVKDSAEAAEFLHSDIVLQESNEPRGRSIKRENTKPKN